MRKTLLAAVLFAISTSASAYQWELDANLGLAFASVDSPSGEDDGDGDGDGRFLVAGTYYLQDVSTQQGPLDEAEFLTKASKVKLGIGYHGEYDSLAYRFDEGVIGRSTGLEVKNVMDDYIVVGAVSYGKLDGSRDLEVIRQSRVAIGFGRYLTDTTALVVSYVNNEDNRDYLPSVGGGIVYREDQGLDIAAKTFTAFDGGQSISYGGNLALMHTRVLGSNASGMRWELGGHIAYHPTRYWALKAAAFHTDFTENNYVYKRNLLNLTARYYFVETFAADFNLGHISGEDEFGDVSGANLGFKPQFRF